MRAVIGQLAAQFELARFTNGNKQDASHPLVMEFQLDRMTQLMRHDLFDQVGTEPAALWPRNFWPPAFDPFDPGQGVAYLAPRARTLSAGAAPLGGRGTSPSDGRGMVARSTTVANVRYARFVQGG